MLKFGIPHCPICGREITKLSTDEIVDRIIETAVNKKPHPNPLLKKEREKEENASRTAEIEILSPVVRNRKGEYSTLLLDMYRRGYSKAYVSGKKIELES